MPPSIFRYILAFSKSQQVFMLVVVAVSFPFLYVSLDIPKIIINSAIGGRGEKMVFGQPLDAIPYLLVLCGAYLVLVFINGGFKYFINVYRGILAERLLRRLRYMLIERVLRFPLPYFRTVSRGEIVSMVTTETEPLGGYFGDALSLPAFQGGTLITIMAFMVVQDPILGIAAMALYPIQAYMIPKLQRKVNLLGKERVQAVRKLSERLDEMVSGVSEVRAHDTYRFELADFSSRLGEIFHIRHEIYRQKFFIKFLNNFLAQLTPFFFFSIGGYLVIHGDLSFGSLVAVLAAYKDLSAPWKELLNYYQRMEDARIKYDQLIDKFQPGGMMEDGQIGEGEAGEAGARDLPGPLVASNLTLEEEGGVRVVENASFSLDLRQHVALIGSGSSGKGRLAQLLVGQVSPTDGTLRFGERDLQSLPTGVTGRQTTYLDQDAFIRAGTLWDNLLYGLKHMPTREAPYGDDERTKRQKDMEESARAGNLDMDSRADWIDYAAVGADDGDQLADKVIEVLRQADLEDDALSLGLRQVVDPAARPELVDGILLAREIVGERLKDPELAELVAPFDRDSYNSYASVAENILFGSPIGDTFAVDSLGRNEYVRGLLRDAGLDGTFLTIGHKVAALMVELFQDLPPGHEFFERFSFFRSDQLPEFQRVVNTVNNVGMESLNDADAAMLLDLPFKLIPARHRLGLLPGRVQDQILAVRHAFAESLPKDLEGAVEFFDIKWYNAALSLQDNILFGKTVETKVEGAARIKALLDEVIDQLDLRRDIIRVGLEFDVGIGGKRLTPEQRQKVALARSLLKNPKLTVVNQALTSLDGDAQRRIRERVRSRLSGRGLVWVANDAGPEDRFDRILVADGGRIRDAAGAAAEREAAEKAAAEKAAREEAAEAEGAEAGDSGERSELGDEAELLASIPLFAGLDSSRLKLLAFSSDRLSLSPEEYLMRQGDRGTDAFLIIDGQVDVILDTMEGPMKVATVGRGEVIGELAMLCDQPRTASVAASVRTSLLRISKHDFFKLIEDNAQIGTGLTRTVAERLAQTLDSFRQVQGFYDAMTGLPNRRHFIERLKHAVTLDRRLPQPSALLVMTLDDKALRGVDLSDADRKRISAEAAQRIRDCLRESDTVGHISSSTFGVIAVGAGPEADLEVVRERLEDLFDDPIELDDWNQVTVVPRFRVMPMDPDGLSQVEKLA